jgi:acetyl esterase/lipase
MRVKYICIFFIFCASCASNKFLNSESPWIDLGSISYGTDPNQYIEITAPRNNNQNVNVIFYIHGYGNKMVDLTFLEKYREEYIIGKLDYRYLTPERPELSMDELLSDVHKGLETLMNTVEMNGIKPNRVIMIGNSLGSTLTLMYSYTFRDTSPIPIAFCVTMAGLTDMTDAMSIHFLKRPGSLIIRNYLLSIISILSSTKISLNDINGLGFSDTAFEALKKYSVIYNVSGSVPPTIILHDTNDQMVPFSNSVSLNHVLNVYDVPHIFIQSTTNSGHELGVNIKNRNGRVFAPANARFPVSTPRRYTRKLHPLLEEKLLEAIDQYIAVFCS